MGSKRGKLEVIRDILLAIRDKNGRIRRTHILYKANLSHQMLEEYLGGLIKKELVLEEEKKKSRVYSLTDKGFEYLNQFDSISGFMDFFGFD